MCLDKKLQQPFSLLYYINKNKALKVAERKENTTEFKAQFLLQQIRFI